MRERGGEEWTAEIERKKMKGRGRESAGTERNERETESEREREREREGKCKGGDVRNNNYAYSVQPIKPFNQISYCASFIIVLFELSCIIFG